MLFIRRDNPENIKTWIASQTALAMTVLNDGALNYSFISGSSYVKIKSNFQIHIAFALEETVRETRVMII